MKIKFMSAPAGNAAKLFSTFLLSAFLVACGGGGSSDATTDGATDSTDTGVLDGTDVGGGDEGFTDLDLNPDTTTDGMIDSVTDPDDTNANGIPDADEECRGRGGSDNASKTDTWADNCWLQADIDTSTAEADRSPFYNSTYTLGVQRVLYCG